MNEKLTYYFHSVIFLESHLIKNSTICDALGIFTRKLAHTRVFGEVASELVS